VSVAYLFDFGYGGTPTGEFADGQDLPLAVRGRVENGGVKSDTFFGLYLDEVD